VTDKADLLQGPHGWKVVLAGGLAVLSAAAATLAIRATDPASADTYLTGAHNAAVRTVDGDLHTAAAGERLARGATVLTGVGGSAQLATGGRTVYLGAGSTVRVLDGVHQQLQRGLVMVDSREGARLDLDTLAGKVATAAGALARVETAAQLRLAVYDGSAALTAAGRSATATVDRLHQVLTPYGQVAGRTTVLALTPDDPWEARLVADLVAADQDLTHLADSLGGGDGAALLTAAPAALRTVPTPPVGPARGETALAVALAQAARGGDATTALSTVQSGRREGGSWGVVAALVGARVTAVSALLDGALAPVPGGPGGPTIIAGGLPSVPGLFGPTATPTVVPTTGPTTGPIDGPTPTRPTTRPPTTPPSSPPPGLVEGLVDTVLGLLPPAPAPSPTPPAPPAAPTPAKPLLELDLLGLNLTLGG
jgi:hypothetical protein